MSNLAAKSAGTYGAAAKHAKNVLANESRKRLGLKTSLPILKRSKDSYKNFHTDVTGQPNLRESQEDFEATIDENGKVVLMDDKPPILPHIRKLSPLSKINKALSGKKYIKLKSGGFLKSRHGNLLVSDGVDPGAEIGIKVFNFSDTDNGTVINNDDMFLSFDKSKNRILLYETQRFHSHWFIIEAGTGIVQIRNDFGCLGYDGELILTVCEEPSAEIEWVIKPRDKGFSGLSDNPDTVIKRGFYEDGEFHEGKPLVDTKRFEEGKNYEVEGNLLKATAVGPDGVTTSYTDIRKMDPEDIKELRDTGLLGNTLLDSNSIGNNILSNPLINNTLIGNPLINNTLIGNPLINNTLIGNPLINNTLIGNNILGICGNPVYFNSPLCISNNYTKALQLLKDPYSPTAILERCLRSKKELTFSIPHCNKILLNQLK